MRSPPIVIVDVFIDRSLQVLVTKYQAVVKAFFADAPYAAFCDGVGLWCSELCTDLFDSQRSKAPVEYGIEAAVSIVNQESWRLC